MRADHKGPVLAFVVLAVLAAAVVGSQARADAGLEVRHEVRPVARTALDTTVGDRRAARSARP